MPLYIRVSHGLALLHTPHIFCQHTTTLGCSGGPPAELTHFQINGKCGLCFIFLNKTSSIISPTFVHFVRLHDTLQLKSHNAHRLTPTTTNLVEQVTEPDTTPTKVRPKPIVTVISGSEHFVNQPRHHTHNEPRQHSHMILEIHENTGFHKPQEWWICHRKDEQNIQ